MNRISPTAALLACLPGLALAQEDGVVVSATRAPRPALEVPASVDRIYADEIREGRPQVNLSESIGRVPGIVVQNRQNYAQDLQVQSRGFGARATFGVRGIRLVSDGIPATMPDGQGQAATFALGSARSIEVLRGPFSALYGNSAGGVIVVETEDGPERPTVEGGYWLGSYGSSRTSFKAGGQAGAVNAIADFSRFDTDGYRQHSAAQRDHLNAKVRYQASSDTSITLVANSLRQLQTHDPGGLTRALFDQNPRQVIPQAITFDTRKSVIQQQGGLNLSHRLEGGARVQAIAYYGERYQEQFLALNANGVVNIDRGFGGGALRWSGELGERVRISAGAEYDLMHDRRKGFNNVNGVRGALTRDEDNEAWSTGLYTQAEWKLAERWALHGGLRHTRVRFRNTDYFLGNGDGSGDRSYGATTPVAGLVWRMTPKTSFYANTGRGFETPTFLEIANQPGAVSGINFGLNAATSRHLEAGAKTTELGWARLDAAVFSVITDNEIVVDTNVAGRATFKNVGKTDRTGLELAAETLGTGPWEARIAYTYLKAVYRDAFSTQILTAGPQVAVPAGSQIAGVPRTQVFGELRYRREAWWAGAEALYKDRVAVNDANSEFAGAFTVINLSAGLVQRGGPWRLTEFVRVDNVTDRNYAGSVIVNEGNGRYYEPSPRRNMTLGLQASLQF